MNPLNKEGRLLLGVDTCGSQASVALVRVQDGPDGPLQLLEQRTIPGAISGGELSVKLLPAIADLLAGQAIRVSELGGIVAVAGPGSFTGIRVGLAAVKGLAEAAGIPVVAISRLAILSAVTGTACALLDAYRGQMFCGMYEAGQAAREMLLTAGDIPAMGGLPQPMGVCEDAVAHLLETLLDEPRLVRVQAPAAWDAVTLAIRRWRAREFADTAALDGYYLRGADAKTQAELAARQA